jgi:hypothetical protein
MWSAVAVPARDRSPGPRKRRVRYGRPRCMAELIGTFAESQMRRQEIASAIQYLRERGLLPDDVIIPVERSRRMPPQSQKPRIVKAKPQSWPRKLHTKEYHRDFD